MWDLRAAAAKALASKWASSSNEEYALVSNSDETVSFLLVDASTDGIIDFATTSAYTGRHLFSGTYDGSRSHIGVAVQIDAVAVAGTASLSGTYVAMENLGATFDIGQRQGAAQLSGSLEFVLVCAKQLSIDDLWSIKALCNAFYDLAL